MELLILLAVLQVADVISTLRFLKAGVPEANPILSVLFDEIGVIPTLAVSKAALLYTAWVFMDEPYWNEVVIAACAVYTFVVIRNWRLVK